MCSQRLQFCNSEWKCSCNDLISNFYHFFEKNIGYSFCKDLPCYVKNTQKVICPQLTDAVTRCSPLSVCSLQELFATPSAKPTAPTPGTTQPPTTDVPTVHTVTGLPALVTRLRLPAVGTYGGLYNNISYFITNKS